MIHVSMIWPPAPLLFSPGHAGSGRYLSVISVSGCETMVMNQTALKNSDQNVSQ